MGSSRAARHPIVDDHDVRDFSMSPPAGPRSTVHIAATMAAGAALVIMSGCGGSASSTTTTRTAIAVPPALRRAAPERVRVRRTPDPGTLPQTDAKPSSGPALTVRMQVLWRAIIRDAPSLAKPVFFPESAYRQVKAIWNPGGDYRTRIWAIFTRDVAAYRRALGAHAVNARLVGTIAAPGAAGWVPTGVCENAVGYWHLPGTRLVYVIGRTRYSVGVDSMISWRGAWYVIHLGPDTTPGSPGTVDDPQVGTGSPGYGAGC
jgi:hypothetical protein